MSVRDRYDSEQARRPPTIDDRWRLRIQQEIATDIIRAALDQPSMPFSRAVLHELQQCYRTGALHGDDMRLRSTSREQWRALGRALVTIVQGPTIAPPAASVPRPPTRGALYR